MTSYNSLHVFKLQKWDERYYHATKRIGIQSCKKENASKNTTDSTVTSYIGINRLKSRKVAHQTWLTDHQQVFAPLKNLMFWQFATLVHSGVLPRVSKPPPPQIASFLTLKATLSIHPFSIHPIQLVLIRITGGEAAVTLYRPCHHVKP